MLQAVIRCPSKLNHTLREEELRATYSRINRGKNSSHLEDCDRTARKQSSHSAMAYVQPVL